ncbi:hypothetical protein [Aeromicrobium sp. UC242_57]|uniref:hypothetical protein n=1 Tax=Aeromicrobium sp. UC242_57 TaxID=3374624 RepID=UPI0037908920
MEQPLIEAFNAADAMVSDISGIVVDFMASAKPLVMYAAQYSDPAAFRASHPSAEAAYVIDRDLTLLDASLDAALGKDPLAASRQRQADRYLGGTDRADPARRFVELVKELRVQLNLGHLPDGSWDEQRRGGSDDRGNERTRKPSR